MLMRHSDAAPSTPARRARRRFWLLVVVAVLSGGAVTRALAAAPGPLTGLGVAASGLILIGSLAGAVRIMIALERARERAHDGRDR